MGCYTQTLGPWVSPGLGPCAWKNMNSWVITNFATDVKFLKLSTQCWWWLWPYLNVCLWSYQSLCLYFVYVLLLLKTSMHVQCMTLYIPFTGGQTTVRAHAASKCNNRQQCIWMLNSSEIGQAIIALDLAPQYHSRNHLWTFRASASSPSPVAGSQKNKSLPSCSRM